MLFDLPAQVQHPHLHSRFRPPSFYLIHVGHRQGYLYFRTPEALAARFSSSLLSFPSPHHPSRATGPLHAGTARHGPCAAAPFPLNPGYQ